MAYLEQVRQAEGNPNRYALMAKQALHAKAIIAGEATLDPEIFALIPWQSSPEHTEADGSITEFQDITSAFSAGFYAHVYGPASANQRFRESGNVYGSLGQWNRTITASYQSLIKPAAFKRLFLEGGLWRAFITDETSTGQELRANLATGDFRKLHNEQRIVGVLKRLRPYFLRVEPGNGPSHIGSHGDAAFFANSVLRTGERELGMRDEDDKIELLKSSLRNSAAQRSWIYWASTIRSLNSSCLPSPTTPSSCHLTATSF